MRRDGARVDPVGQRQRLIHRERSLQRLRERGEAAVEPDGEKLPALALRLEHLAEAPLRRRRDRDVAEGDRALETYLATCPSAQEERIETYRSEPYVYAQMIAGPDAATPGEAKNSWLTGTAAWTFVSLAEGILGIEPDYDGLRIDPCIPRAWDGFRVTRRFRGTVYEIEVSNPDGASGGVRSPRAKRRR